MLKKKKRKRGRKKKCRHILTCCSIFVNIVNHGLADGNVNCTCGSNKTSRLITFTNSDYHYGAAGGFNTVPRGIIYSGRTVCKMNQQAIFSSQPLYKAVTNKHGTINTGRDLGYWRGGLLCSINLILLQLKKANYTGLL